MTAIATIGALLPLAISTDGGLISRALAVVVIGGLSTSTLLTLVIVPVIFSLVTRNRRSAKALPVQHVA
jgi:multidrug efflux pump subunit AcrB